MIGAILIDAVGVLLGVLLILMSIKHHVFYAKPFIGVMMFIAFGAAFMEMAIAAPSAGLLSSLLVSTLGMIIGLGWTFDGLDRLYYLKEGKK